ncbi:MAG TPA: hypothetical protein PKA91_19565, partial [Leptospiraceae bacterium]|nr:hypothetical protein [Leptospiraceae bacterium]
PLAVPAKRNLPSGDVANATAESAKEFQICRITFPELISTIQTTEKQQLTGCLPLYFAECSPV